MTNPRAVEAPRIPVTDSYHGVEVTEEYRWLEDASSAETIAWTKAQPPRQRPFLVTLTDLDDTGTERIVVDPEAIDPSGETTIDWFVPSPDGRLVAVSLSEHGTEDGSLH